MKNILVALAGILTFALTSCETPVELDLEQSEPRLAVEAVVTDQPDMNFVKLHLSAPYAKNIDPQAVTDAQVKLVDNTGISTSLIHKGNGTYKPASPFAGEIGRTYTLTILANGKTYTATSTLHPVTKLDKVTYEYVDGKNDDFGREEGYYISTAFRDSAGVKNYYKLNIAVNGQLRQDETKDIIITEDKLYDGSYLDDIRVPATFAKNDALDVSLLSLTKEAFDFYNALQGLSGQGGLFDRNPANLPTNISNGGVGFFSASAISTRSLTIE
ncbi:DUF4249 domain-containing protein [Telluribacter humicola]|uniref:DUF4249 domain-containing protein n=1 Tax=Telluribacter humicola TaxID=1720261 RepID=UPI001A96921A|nr:DUF4249 domain-containing protein [Telluribacter humicola]